MIGALVASVSGIAVNMRRRFVFDLFLAGISNAWLVSLCAKILAPCVVPDLCKSQLGRVQGIRPLERHRVSDGGRGLGHLHNHFVNLT